MGASGYTENAESLTQRPQRGGPQPKAEKAERWRQKNGGRKIATKNWQEDEMERV
jgi:hypothetical protein